MQQPVQLQSSRRIARQRRKQKAVRDDHLAFDQSRNDLMLKTVTEIGRMKKAKLLLIERPHVLSGFNNGLDELGRIPLRGRYAVA